MQKVQTDSRIIINMFMKLLPVQIILVAIGSLNGIIDGAMASRLIGSEALTATGLFTPIVTFMNMVNAVMVGGASILCGQFMGKNQVNRTKSIFTLDILMVCGVGLFLTMLCLILPGGVSYFLGARGEMIGKLSEYIRGYTLGFLASMLASQLSSFLQMERQEHLTYVAIGVMLFMNAGLDYLLVGVMGLGMFGLGLATTISNWFFLMVQAIHYFTPKAIIRFDVHSVEKPDAKQILLIGFPGALSQACQMVRGLYLNHAILRFAGEEGMSAYAAISTFGGLYFATIAGVAASSRILISIYSGEEDRAGLIAIMKAALHQGMGLAVVVNAIFIALAVPITNIFYHDPTTEVYRLAVWGFRLFPISMVLACFNLIFCNCFQCTNKVRMINVLSLVDGLLGTVFTASILYPLLGGMGIWVTQLVNGFYAIIIIIVHAWIVNKKCAIDTESLMTLDKNLGVSERNRVDITIRSVEEVVHTSEQIISFCRRHRIDPKRSYYAGLCFEEMAGNIVEHGFHDGKKHSVDIRVVYKGKGELLMRLRDDCKPFNPQERAELFAPEDVTHNIGLRMVSRIAKSMNYQNMLGLNVLTLQI